MRSLSPLVLAAAVLLAITTTAAQETLVFANGFENGAFVTSPSGSSETGIISSCSGATASVNSVSPRTGSYAAVLTVKTVCANWRLKLQTRYVTLTTSNSYSLCMWVKSNYTAKPFLPKIAFSFYHRNGTLIDAVQPRINDQWARYCYHVHKVPVDNQMYFWNLNVGNANASTAYYIDDITLTSEPNAQFDNYVDNSAARIEQLRKGDFKLNLTYNDGTPVPAAAVQSLAVTMKKHDFPFGVAYSIENFATSQVAEKAFYNSKAGQLFNGMVPENAFKWPYFEPTKGKRAAGLALLNQFYNFTAANDFQYMRMHNIEWFLNDPEFTGHWSRKPAGNCTMYPTYLKNRIQQELALFPGVVKSLDVFNELLERRTYAETCNLFAGGPNSVIVQAFKWANEVRPDIKLCLNDYWILDTERWVNIVELVEWLLTNGAPVHCIGAQSHLGPDVTPDTMAYRLHKISTLLNLPVEVTEISFHTTEDPVTWEQTMTDEGLQAQAFEKMLKTYFSHPNVTASLLWGFVDTNHYITNGGIFRADGSPKPAGTIVEQLITQTWNTSSPDVTITPDNNLQKFRGFYGRYDVTVTLAGPVTPYTQTKRVSLPATNGPLQTVTVTLDIPPPTQQGRRMLRM